MKNVRQMESAREEQGSVFLMPLEMWISRILSMDNLRKTTDCLNGSLVRAEPRKRRKADVEE